MAAQTVAVVEKESIEIVARSVAGNLGSIVGPRVSRFVRGLSATLEFSLRNRYRVMVVYPGSDPVKLGAAVAKTLLYYEKVYRREVGGSKLKLLYVFHDEFDDARLRKEIVRETIGGKSKLLDPTIAVYEGSEKFLGTTFQALVLDLVNDLKPNDVGRLASVVEGGGIIVVEAPSWSSWDNAMTIFKRNLLVPGFEEPRHIFISWFKSKLLEYKDNIYVYDIDSSKLLSGTPYTVEAPPRGEITIPSSRLFPKEVYELALTRDQVNVINLMEWLYERPPKGKRKVIVVTADRGRGKSCAVGIGLIGLAKLLGEVKHRVRILVTAPELSNVQSLMELALKAAEAAGLEPKPVKRGDYIIEIQGRKFSLEYWEPYVIPKLGGDIVAVDEASGIHVPLLHKIWESHERIVFAATIHGYEGAGRGFSVRFLSAIKKDQNTIIKTISMEEPIRYSSGDPVEKWLFKTLLLDTEPAELESVDYEDVEAGNLEYVKLDPKQLFSPEGEEVLRHLFGIYVLAHYRNEPDDLGLLADAPHHIIRAVKTARGGRIVSAVQIAEEGGLGEETVERLLRGEKMPGNIIPDRLLKHQRVREIGSMKGWRIVRIATHPLVQDRGVGSKTLSFIVEEASERGLDWVGSGFGVNEKLLKFWVKNGFRAVHLSPDRNPVSGEYTALVIRGVRSGVDKIVDIMTREFKVKLLNSLYDTYRDLEVEVAHIILSQKPEGLIEGYKPQLSPIQVDRLWTYAYSFSTYEACNDIVYELAKTYWLQRPTQRPPLNKIQELLLIAKALQGNSWEDLEQTLGVRAYELTSTMREIVRKMAEHYYSLKEDSKVGLNTSDIIG